ncbi:MAG: 3-dehydroquinate dehydratase, partial [Spirochaetales bacterium]
THLEGRTALVIGAGGAARGVVYALLSHGATVVLTNRTLERARVLAAEVGTVAERAGAVQVCEETATISGPFDIVVQTTSVGMHGNGDPAPCYRFDGSETAFDVVYTPPVTPFLERAVAAGCTVIQGDVMFDFQAAAQYALYSDLAVTASGGV